MSLTDTADEARRVQVEVYRRMTPSERVDVAIEMTEAALEISREGIRLRHPGYGEEQVRWALFRLRLDDDSLFRAVWPSAPLLQP
jgi:hypothetical protein